MQGLARGRDLTGREDSRQYEMSASRTEWEKNGDRPTGESHEVEILCENRREWGE